MSSPFIAYGGLFLWSFLAATVLPLGSEAALIALVRSDERVFAPVLVATIGNYLGSCTTYWLGRRAAKSFIEGKQASKNQARAAHLLKRYGQPALLLSWVPLIGDVLVAFAGAMRQPFGAFTFWVVIGKALRYAAVAWVASAI